MNLNAFDDFNITSEDKFYLIFLVAFSLILTCWMINFNLNLGIYCSDVLVYLTNALYYSGVNLGNSSTMYLSPVICCLTSILIRLGITNELSIYIITGLFAVIGNIGLYALLKIRFSSLLSLVGAVLFSSFSLNLLWLANGTLDIPAVALSILIVLFMITANKNHKFYILVVPFCVLAFFTRYTTGFVIPLIALYYCFNKNIFYYLFLFVKDFKLFKSNLHSYLKSKEFKSILISCIFGVILTALFIIIIKYFGSNLTFLGQSSEAVSGSKGSILDSAYTTDTFFYIHDFLNFLFADKVVFNGKIPVLVGVNPLAYLISLIMCIGIINEVFKFFKSLSFNSGNSNTVKLNFDNTTNVLNNGFFNNGKFILLMSLITLCLSVLSFKFNSIVSITFLLIFALFLNSLLKIYSKEYCDNYKLNLLFMVWFLSYMIFFTLFNIKVNRYIITVLPSFVYFFVLSLESLVSIIKKRFIDSNLDSKQDCQKEDVSNEFSCDLSKFFNLRTILPIILIVLAIVYAFSFSSIVEIDDTIKSPNIIADYLINYDENYSSVDIATYNVRFYDWLLKKDTIPLIDEKLDYLDASNITYYISNNRVNLENYTLIHRENDLYLYKHI